MTRINIVDPIELTDQHLFAEFREIKMVPSSLNRSLISRGVEGVLSRIPTEFTLNTGHVTFFYDKGLYLSKRFEDLKEELRKRRYNFDELTPFDQDSIYQTDNRLFKDYEPDEKALAIIRQRIEERINQKRHWYRYYGKPLGN